VRNGYKSVALIGCGALAALLALGWLVNREPSFRGKPLSYWVAAHAGQLRESSYDPNATQYKYRPDFALGVMGSNAAPYLIDWMTQRPYGWQVRLGAYATGKGRFASFVPRWATGVSTESRAKAALQALPCLGAMASPAIPKLLPLAANPTNRVLALGATRALCSIGPQAIPALILLATNQSAPRVEVLDRLGEAGTPAAIPAVMQSLSDPDAYVCSAAARALRRLKPDAKAALPALLQLFVREPSPSSFAQDDFRYDAVLGIAALGTNADPVVPTLLLKLKGESSRDSLLCAIMEALGKVSARPQAVLPTLTSYLESTNGLLRHCAALALCRMGPRAQPALASLTNALQFEDTRKMVEVAIWRISSAGSTNAPGH
jgi:hypothetical protein